VGHNMTHCDYNHKNPQTSCVVDVKQFEPCTTENKYGYAQGKPCIFLKLNKIYNWEPQVYDAPIPTMPDDLQKAINDTSIQEVG